MSSLPEGWFVKEIFLDKLHLDRKNIIEFPNGTMKYLYHLLVLNMSRNLIDRLSGNSFDYLGSVQVSYQILKFSWCDIVRFARWGQVRLGNFGPKFLILFLSYWEVKKTHPLYIGLRVYLVLLKNFLLINHDQMHNTTT